MSEFADREIIIQRERYYAHSIDEGDYVAHDVDREVITGSDLEDLADSLGRWESDDSGRAVWVKAGLAETVASLLWDAGTVDGPHGAGTVFDNPLGPEQIGFCEEPDCGRCEGEFQSTDAFLRGFTRAEIQSIAAALAEHARRMREDLS